MRVVLTYHDDGVRVTATPTGGKPVVVLMGVTRARAEAARVRLCRREHAIASQLAYDRARDREWG